MKHLLIIIILLLTTLSFATTLTVKQDGTGDYTIIQNAINATTNGDTILVYPGTYYENLLCQEKNITIGSLTLTTGNPLYSEQTIIDANHVGGCFDIKNCQLVTIDGFTLINGIGNYKEGGAIRVKYSTVDIYNCIIQNNAVTGNGGGIFYYESQSYLSNTTIRNNSAYYQGGGILIANSSIEFDPINKCNIYLNYAAKGTDICGLGDAQVHIIIDTFTVNNPDYYYLYSDEYMGYPGNDLTFDINTGKIEAVSQNLYVAPTGNNNNSGLSPTEPLKNISYALLVMASDSISPDTIHIANGLYTLSSGEKYPLSLKRDVSIVGQSRDSTILDAENQIYMLHGIFYASNYSITNLTLQRGNGDVVSYFSYGAVMLTLNDNASLKNILFKENYGTLSPGGRITTSNNFSLNNVEFINNSGGAPLRVGYTFQLELPDTVHFNSCKVMHNTPDYTIPDGAAGGGIAIIGQTETPNHITGVFINCLFTENESQNINNGAGANAVSVGQAGKAYIINCTLADNASNNLNAASIGVTYGSTTHVYNSIIYNDEYAPAYMYTQDWAGECNLNIYNSLIDGGESAINIISPFNNLYYDETNIDADPLFYGGSEYPYNLNDLSPCINTGTLDLPDWIELPEFDLAGNPRIVGGAIDMGAYEWNPTVGVNEYQPIKKQKEKLLTVAPNPFGTRTTISAKFPIKSHVKLEIYNNYGQRVVVFMNEVTLPGASHIIWLGEDYNNQVLPAGIYHVVMFVDDKEVENIKVIKK